MLIFLRLNFIIKQIVKHTYQTDLLLFSIYLLLLLIIIVNISSRGSSL